MSLVRAGYTSGPACAALVSTHCVDGPFCSIAPACIEGINMLGTHTATMLLPLYKGGLCWPTIVYTIIGRPVLVTFCHSQTPPGQKFNPILLMLWHPTPRALCHRVEKNTDTLVKGMILFDQGGDGEERGKRSWTKLVLPSVCGPLVFCFVCSKDIF